jgi:hypothetical protein
MNPMTATARKLNPDGSLGEWVVGYPCQGIEHLYMYETMKYFDLPVVVDPATLNYETGKRDCKGRMIYGGMEVNVHRFAFKDCIYKVMFCNIKLCWILIDGSYWLYLCQFESKDIKIMEEGE